MNITIDVAKPEDFDAVNSIVKEGQDLHAEALPYIFRKVDPVMPRSYFKELLESQDAEIFVAKINHEIVGFAIMDIKVSPPFDSMTPRKYAYMSDFGVSSNVQKTGIGSALFDACVEWSKTVGASDLELNVWEFNEKAISFYEKKGMKNLSRKMNLVLK
ncbi:GNAT family N-acetyltransferase [Cytobacillus sp. FJAT-54145]|uniref:GNAT family N-acetyltransferase n=1 Tax=Cytobacillus spartinae TaxID=3299023 RepID=A0ABW6K905_9BACI